MNFLLACIVAVLCLMGIFCAAVAITFFIEHIFGITE
jgi:hypothetical protein